MSHQPRNTPWCESLEKRACTNTLFMQHCSPMTCFYTVRFESCIHLSNFEVSIWSWSKVDFHCPGHWSSYLCRFIFHFNLIENKTHWLKWVSFTDFKKGTAKLACCMLMSPGFGDNISSKAKLQFNFLCKHSYWCLFSSCLNAITGCQDNPSKKGPQEGSSPNHPPPGWADRGSKSLFLTWVHCHWHLVVRD